MRRCSISLSTNVSRVAWACGPRATLSGRRAAGMVPSGILYFSLDSLDSLFFSKFFQEFEFLNIFEKSQRKQRIEKNRENHIMKFLIKGFLSLIDFQNCSNKSKNLFKQQKRTRNFSTTFGKPKVKENFMQGTPYLLFSFTHRFPKLF